MDKNHGPLQTHCLNCGASVKGAFCHQCGQRIRDNSDRSLRRLLGEVLGNIFFFDNRFFISVWYLIRFPGRMTVEFLEGKRKKFISPVTLFLFLNLIYFFVNPLSDYSLPLTDQFYSQPYSQWIQEMVVQKLTQEELDGEAYAITYQNASDNISKSIMIINVPLIAGFVFLMAFKRRPFFFDSLIFAFHFFTLFLLSWILLDWAGRLIDLFSGHESSVVSAISFNLFTLILPLVYAILSTKRLMVIRWYWAIPAGLGVMVAVLLTNVFYRFIILMLTLWTT